MTGSPATAGGSKTQTVPAPLIGGTSIPAEPAGPSWTLLALFVSLIGFLGIAYILWAFKYQGIAQTLDGLPTRVLFVFFLALVAAPFFVTIFRRIPIPTLILPVVLIMFLYPLFSPYGLPFSRDPVYNFQFAQVLQSTGSWSPTTGVVSQAVTYSYYPGGAVFNAEVSQFTNLPLLSTFNWSFDLFRLLVIPLLIYALTVRVFGPRPAALAVLLYISIPSIELDIPTQQDFAVTFFLVGLVAIAYLVNTPAADSLFLRIMVVLAGALVIVSHHVSTYLLVLFLLGLAVIPWILKRRDPYPNVKSTLVFLETLAMGLVWVAFVTLPVLTEQYGIFSADLAAVFHPAQAAPSATPVPGSSFPAYQLLWIGAAIAIVAIGALLTLVEKYGKDEEAFIVFGIITVFLVAIISIPFLTTGLSFLALRQLEYSGVILAPVAAWWFTEKVARGRFVPAPSPAPPPTAPRTLRSRTPHRSGPVLVAGLLVLVVVTGGFLVPLSTRDQFANPSQLDIDSPMYINENAKAAANWADTYVPKDHAIWGDYLAYTVFGGFGDFRTVWNSYPLFEGTTFSASGVGSLHRGDLVVLDIYMTSPHLNPIFPGPLSDQPAGGLIPPADLTKFQNPTDFALLYENSIFTVYEVTAIPAAGSG